MVLLLFLLSKSKSGGESAGSRPLLRHQHAPLHFGELDAGEAVLVEVQLARHHQPRVRGQQNLRLGRKVRVPAVVRARTRSRGRRRPRAHTRTHTQTRSALHNRATHTRTHTRAHMMGQHACANSVAASRRADNNNNNININNNNNNNTVTNYRYLGRFSY